MARSADRTVTTTVQELNPSEGGVPLGGIRGSVGWDPATSWTGVVGVAVVVMVPLGIPRGIPVGISMGIPVGIPMV